MKKWGKRIAIVLGVLVGVLALGLGGAYAASLSKEGTTYAVQGMTFDVPSDPESLAEGERLYMARGCGSPDCHLADGGGRVMMEDGPFGTITAANLTVATAGYTPADWDRAVRHGLRRDSRSLVFMPAVDFVEMSERELGLIVAHVRSMPRVERELPATAPGMLARMIDLADGFELFPASAIDHAAVAAPDAEPGRTVEYGRYLAAVCTGCHGATFSGGPIPGAPPELGNPANLTPHETGLAGWTEEQLRAVLREGRVPSGRQIDPAQMPYPVLARMTDDEIGALFLFLQSLPPRPEGNR
jgi:mono/diheme cytochrome c family protein